MDLVNTAAGVPQVSIIVPCRNEWHHIRKFLKSLLHQELDGLSCEVLIADGMSEDGTREILEQYHKTHTGLRVIDNPEKIVPTGLNRAILAARGEFVVRLDVHTEYAPDYIATCIRVLQRTGADNVGGPMRNVATTYVERAIAAAFHSRFSCGGARFHREDYEGYVDTVTYGCWRRSTLLRLGLFDPALVRNQDDELNLRLIRSGGKIWQSPRIVMSYHPRSTLKTLFVQYVQYGFWKVAVIRKHRLPASWRHLVPALFVLGTTLPPMLAVGGSLARNASLANLAWLFWGFSLAAYLLSAEVASVAAAARKGWDLVPILPVVYATYHIAYGVGFLFGLLRGRMQPGDNVATYTPAVRQASR